MTETQESARPGPWAWLAIAISYGVVARLSLLLAYPGTSSSPFWIPAGIALAAVWHYGNGVWPAIFAGAFAANVLAMPGGTGTGMTLLAAGLMAAGNSLEALAGGWLLRRLWKGGMLFDGAAQVLRFVLAVLATALCSAVIGPAVQSLFGILPAGVYPVAAITWWLGDVVGILLMTPLLLAFLRPAAGLPRRSVVETIGLGLTFGAGLALTYGGIIGIEPYQAMTYLALPPLLWAAFRFGPRATMLLMLGSALAVTLYEVGAHPSSPPAALNVRLLNLLAYCAVNAVTLATLLAILAERQRAQAGLAALAASLESRVEARTAELQSSLDSLARVNAEKNQFLGMAAHDLRSPLATISGYSGVLLGGSLGPLGRKQTTLIERIRVSAQFMRRLVDELLDFTKIEAGRLQLELRPTDLNQWVADALILHGMMAETKQISLSLLRAEGLPVLTVDARRIEQVVNNLVINALKFAPIGSEVVVRLEWLADTVCLSVSDQGPGIHPDVLANLFKPFNTALSTGANGEKNTGLGLVIAHKIVSAHGGTLHAVCEPGCGTVFVMELPLNLPSQKQQSRITD